MRNWQFIDEDDTEFTCRSAVRFAQMVFRIDFGAQFCQALRAGPGDFLAKSLAQSALFGYFWTVQGFKKIVHMAQKVRRGSSII
jgi:hypothetical protein